MATRITDRDEDEDRPAKKKKKRKQPEGFPAIYLIIGGVAAFVVLLSGGGLLAYFLTRRDPVEVKPAPLAQGEEKKGAQVFPRIEDGNPDKQGKGLGQGVRVAVWRTERRNELKQLRLSFIQFSDEYKGAARTKENFVEYIKRDFGPIHKAVKDGYYEMNMKARLQGGDIIVYEREEDTQGHLAARSSGELEYVPAAQLKKELGLP